MEDEFRKIHDDIEDLENNIYGKSKKDPGGYWLKLQDCRKRLADPRIGGNGVPDPMEKWEKVSESDPDFQYRVDDENNVVAVSEEQLEHRIANLKKVKTTLDRRVGDYQDKLDSCENRYHTALVQHGLDPEDTKATGEWVETQDGKRVWKMKKASTKSPEELMKRKEERQKKSD